VKKSQAPYQQATSALSMAYKSKALNPSHTADADSTSVSA